MRVHDLNQCPDSVTSFQEGDQTRKSRCYVVIEGEINKLVWGTLSSYAPVGAEVSIEFAKTSVR